MQNSIEFPPDDSTGSESLWYPCFLVCDPHRFFRFHQRHTFASIYLDQEEEEWKQMLAEAPVLDVSTSDFWFFAASRDLTLLCRDAFVGVVLSPLSRYFWMMCFLKQISYISWYIYIQSPPRMSYHIHPFLFRPNLQTEPPQLQGKSSDVNCYSPHATASDRLASPYNRSRPILPKIRDDFIGSQ